MQDEQLAYLEGKRSESLPVIVAKLNLEYIRREGFNDRANLPAGEFAFRKIFGQGDYIQ